MKKVIVVLFAVMIAGGSMMSSCSSDDDPKMTKDDITKAIVEEQFPKKNESPEDMPGWLVANEGQLTIALDIELTQELIEEGIARELINRIQNLRKSSGMEITDRINVTLSSHPQTDSAVIHFHDYIASQVLATSLMTAELTEGESIEINGVQLKVRIAK
jgi:hypothetical protein